MSSNTSIPILPIGISFSSIFVPSFLALHRIWPWVSLYSFSHHTFCPQVIKLLKFHFLFFPGEQISGTAPNLFIAVHLLVSLCLAVKPVCIPFFSFWHLIGLSQRIGSSFHVCPFVLLFFFFQSAVFSFLLAFVWLSKGCLKMPLLAILSLVHDWWPCSHSAWSIFTVCGYFSKILKIRFTSFISCYCLLSKPFINR